MATPTSPSRRRTLNDVGKDNNLAQWTSEIRKMQTEVDMEAEEESRRLQEEIAASRLERERRRANNRRSTGVAPELMRSPEVGELPHLSSCHSVGIRIWTECAPRHTA